MRTNSLFHFTKQLEVIFSILQDGFWPRVSFEDISWVGHHDLYGNPMVCFCDIALSKLTDHTAFYGEYGIGMTKDWGVRNGLNPLVYISDASPLSATFKSLMANAKKIAKVDAMVTLAYTKPLSGRMVVDGKPMVKDFYSECEWRYLDTSIGCLFHSDVKGDKEVEKENEKTQGKKLKFRPNDVRYILIKKEDDVAPLVDFMYSTLGFLSHNELKIMTTKIMILEELKKDI